MDRAHAVDLLVGDLVAAIEERETGDPDSGNWLIDARIRRLEHDLAAAYRLQSPRMTRPERQREPARTEDAAALAGIV